MTDHVLIVFIYFYIDKLCILLFKVLAFFPDQIVYISLAFGDEIGNETPQCGREKSRLAALVIRSWKNRKVFRTLGADMIVELFDRAVCEMPGVSELSINSESSPSSIETLARN